MSNRLPPDPFWIHAGNIHTGENQTYGPFAGPPMMTYEFLRGGDYKNLPDHHFVWIDPQDIDGDDNPHGYATWEDQEGRNRYDGWRQLRNVVTHRNPDGSPRQSHSEPAGPFWTDLTICTAQQHRAHQHA